MNTELSSLSMVRYHQFTEHTQWVPMSQVVGYVMKCARIKAGLTLQQVGDELDCPKTSMCMMEAGTYNFTIPQAAAAARLFGITFADVMLEIHALEQTLRKDKILIVYDEREAAGMQAFDISKLPEPKSSR